MMETRICNSSRKKQNTGDASIAWRYFYEGKPRETKMRLAWDGGFPLEKIRTTIIL
jgi:hypothetical protein